MRFKVGSKYCIQFHDHCVGKDDIVCEVTVYITSQTKTHLYGTWWRVITDDHELEEANREMVTIIKSTIVKVLCFFFHLLFY
jgi:hypothetical protein